MDGGDALTRFLHARQCITATAILASWQQHTNSHRSALPAVINLVPARALAGPPPRTRCCHACTFEHVCPRGTSQVHCACVLKSIADVAARSGSNAACVPACVPACDDRSAWAPLAPQASSAYLSRSAMPSTTLRSPGNSNTANQKHALAHTRAPTVQAPCCQKLPGEKRYSTSTRSFL